MTAKNEKIILLKSRIEQERRHLMYADSPQARTNRLREINYMKAQLKQLEDGNNE